MKTKDVNTFDLVINPELDKAVVNVSFIERLVDNLSQVGIYKIINKLKKQLDTCNTTEDLLSLLEDELIFHRSIGKVRKGQRGPFKNGTELPDLKKVGKIDLDDKKPYRIEEPTVADNGIQDTTS